MPDSLLFIALVLVLTGIAQLVMLAILVRQRFPQQAGSAHSTSTQISGHPDPEITRLRLQALERLVLFAERMTPERLIMRMDPGPFLCMEYAGALTDSIRTEFEHNLSQQIYVEPATWNVLNAARERITEVIHSAARELKPEESGSALAKKVLSRFLAGNENPTVQALKALRREAQTLLYAGQKG